jgi:hypothetical protein
MAAWTSRLSTILGEPLGEVTEAGLQRLVDNAVREDSDLDFKRELYGRTDSDKRELAADIVALANERGGLLIVGVRDVNAVAMERTPVELSGEEVVRMKSVVAGLAVPHVPFEIVVVVSAGNSSQGYYVVIVPPSRWRPHAVRKGEDLRYPRRDGPHKRYMGESEIADLYRDRFRQAGEEVSRLDSILANGLSRVVLPEQNAEQPKPPWLAVALVPVNSGSMSLTLATVREYEQWLNERFESRVPFTGIWGGRVQTSTGPGCVTAGDWYTGVPGTDYAEYHTDGSGFYAQEMPWPEEKIAEAVIYDSELILDGIAALRMLAAHAVEKTGAYSDAVAHMRIYAPTSLMLVSHVDLANLRGVQAPDRNLTLRGEVDSRHTLNLSDLAGSGRDALAAGRIMLNELFQAFGTAEVRQLTADGGIRLPHWSRTWRDLIVQWAENEDVELLTDPLPN